VAGIAFALRLAASAVEYAALADLHHQRAAMRPLRMPSPLPVSQMLLS
jgi:hypothetical protein